MAYPFVILEEKAVLGRKLHGLPLLDFSSKKEDNLLAGGFT